MGVTGKYNRVINLYFYKKESLGLAGAASASALMLATKILTPEHGVKPDIEINGNFTTATYLPVFNISIKNLYLNLNEAQYSMIKVEAGYAGRLITFWGTVLSLYQESPGPDGITRIQCLNGRLDLESWLDGDVNLNFKQGTTLRTVLQSVYPQLGMAGILKCSEITLKADFQFEGKASTAISELQKIFEDYKLLIGSRDKQLYAISLSKKETIGNREIKFLSSPPQQNPGDEDGSYYTTVSAPWEPGLQIGEKLTYPSWQYIKNYTAVNINANGTSSICVQAIAFQFATVSGANNMTVQGYNV